MPAAAVFIGVIAVETGVAAAIGTALVGTITTATVSTAVATAIGSGVISAGLTVAQGGKISDALKSAVIGGVASYVGASVAESVTSSVATAAKEAGYTSIAGSIGRVAGAMAGGGTQSAIGAALTGQDPIKALIKGGLTAGLTSGAMAAVQATTAQIPGFSDLSKNYGTAGAAVQRAVNAGLAAEVLGKDADKAVLNSVLGSVMRSGSEYVKSGIKDLSSTLQTAYNNAVKTGESLDNNVKRQDEIVKDYQATADEINKQHDSLQASLDKYNENKDGYDNYDAKMRRDGYEMVGGDEYSSGSYAKYVGGRTETFYDGEGGTYTQRVGGRWEYGPSRDTFLNEANKYAKIVNDGVPKYDEARAAAEEKLGTLSSELDTLKASIPSLEKTLVEQKAQLDNSVAAFQQQEEANAQYIAKVFNDTLTAKTEVEQALGAPVTDEQLDAFVKTGDVVNAAKDYIDIKTTDLAEAQAAALKEGYRFDPNDPELAAQFLGVRDEADTLAALQSFADARATTVEEATNLYRQTYADIYGPDAEVPEPTSEDLLAFMPAVPTDVASIPDDYQNVAEDVVKGRIQDQFSQDLGFEDYADRTFAQESLGEERPEADFWNQYKGTSGVVGVTGSDVAPVQFGATDEAATFIPQAEANDYAVAPQPAPAEDQFATPEQPFVGPTQQDTFGFEQQFADYAQPEVNVAQAPEQGFGFDQPTTDMVGEPTLADLGVAPESVTADIPGAEVPAFETPTVAEAPAVGQEASMLATAPAELLNEPTTFDYGVAGAPVDTSAISSMLDYGKDQGVQTAAFQPSNIMSDTENVGDIGLRSLVSTQQGGTSAAADDAGIASLTDRSLTETTQPEDLTATTKGSATYSALTGQDPTKTIAGSILDDTSEDVRGGVQSDTLYSGKESEVAPSDTLTAKYLNEPAKETETPEDVGLTARTGNDTTTFAEPSATEQALQGADNDPYALDQFLAPLQTEKTTLPVSQEPARVVPTDLRTSMDEYDDYDWASWDRAVEDYVQQYDAARESGATGGAEPLLTPDGVDESFLDRLTPAERERYLAMQDPNYQNPLEGLAPQDLGISQQNIDSFNQNYNPAGGFGSQWQTVGSDRVMINDDGTGIGINTETGEQYALTPDQVASMIKNGMLNTKGSGYVAATGGTGTRPGGSPVTTGSNVNWDRVAGKLTDALTSPKALAALGGAALGAASKPKGINPKGLRSIATGVNPQLSQTGAKGTKGRGGVRYFEKKAEGGSIDGYAGGGGLGYLKSAHDGMADKIDATIDNKRPAKLSGGEFVIPADVVSHLGNGNSEAGAKQLYDLMERVRKARTGNSAQGKQINPKKYLPK